MGGGATDANAREFGTMLQVVSEGPILGLVNGLKSVYLDGTPVRNPDNSLNFHGVAFALVAGTNTQAMIPGISDVESETAVNVQVIHSSPVSRTISTAGISAIRVRVAIPALKHIDPTSGAESGALVQFKIEKQSPSWNGGAWVTETLAGDGVIAGQFGAKYTKSFRIETPAAGPWTIKVSRLTADHVTGSPDYTQDETWWDAYQEITDAKLRYPYSAVAALKVDSKQFNQIPQLTMEGYGRILDCVPSNYNPTTRAYTGIWDGTFQSAWTDNPAWIWYDLASNTRYGAGTVLDASKLDKWALYTIAQQCDVMVSDGKGGTEPRFRCSVYLQSQEDAIKLLSDMASIFRGMAYWAGGLVTAVQDADASPVAIFTNSNVKDGRFTYQGSARKSRHTAALVSWQDPQNGYQTSVEYVEDQAAIARYGYNPTQVAALGATSQAQAHRLGLWTLLTETMDTEVVSFTSGLEGTTLRPGVIFAQRDEFRAGDGRQGGRIAAGATTTVIPLDSTITLPAGTNMLSVRMADGTVQTSTVTTAAGSVSSLTVSPAFTVAPVALSQWALNVALYRVLTVTKGDGIEYDVTALQHTPAKYALVDGVTVTPGPATAANLFQTPSALTLSDLVRTEKDKLVQTLKADWSGDVTAIYAADASQDYGPWQPMKVNGQSATLDGVTSGTWRVRVRAIYATGQSPWASGPHAVGTPTQTATDAAAAAAAAAAALSSITVPNPNFEQDMASTWPGMASITKASAPTGCPTPYCGRSQARDQIATPKFPVTPGQQLYCEAWIDTTLSPYAASFGLYYEDSTGALFSPVYTATAPAGTPWARESAVYPVPVGAVAAHCFCQTDGGSGFGSAFFTGLRVSSGSAAQIAAAAAASAASSAQASANAALADISNITSDNVLSMGEKSAVIQDWSVLSSEQAGIDAQAAAYAVSHVAYDSALSSLSSYLGGLSPAWNDTTQDTSIVGTTFRTNWENAYTAKTALLNAIYAAAKALADNAQGTANTAVANAAAAQSAANAAQASANTANSAISDISSDSKITSGEKPEIFKDWKAIYDEKTGIDTQATAYGITTEKTAYDNAWTALQTYLNASPILMQNPPTDGAAWCSSSTTISITGTTFRTNFATLYSTRQALLNKIYASAKALADAAQASANTALTQYSDASNDGIITDLERPGLKTLRATLALAVSAAQSQANGMGVGHSTLDTAWSTFTANVDPVLVATGNSAITKATWDGWWSTVYQEVQNLQGVLATTANNAAAYANTLARSSYNLIKNANSENPNATGNDAAGLVSGASIGLTPRSGSYLRYFDSGGGGLYFTDRIPCAAGEQFHFESWIWNTSVSNAHVLPYILFFDASGTNIGATSAEKILVGSAWVNCPVDATAPSGTASVMFHINAAAGNGGFIIDDLYACRKISAGMLEADIAILGVVRSPNWVAGAYGSAPVGFWLGGYARTTTYIDGTTSANCFFELQGDANFGGYRVSTVNNRTFTPFNRILNGTFYMDLANWSTSNAGFAWSSSSSTSGGGSALLFKPTGVTLPQGDRLIQGFSCPPTTASVALTLDTGFATNATGITEGGSVKAYLFNCQTGVETLLATWTYSSSTTVALAWTSRSVDITSYVSGGGDFVLRLAVTINSSNTADTVSIYVDNVKILI